MYTKESKSKPPSLLPFRLPPYNKTVLIKVSSLFFLIFQMVALVQIMRASRIPTPSPTLLSADAAAQVLLNSKSLVDDEDAISNSQNNSSKTLNSIKSLTPNLPPSTTTTTSSENPNDGLYIPSTVVLTMEILKLLLCLLPLHFSLNSSSPKHTFNTIIHNTIHSPYDMLLLTVPSLLYTIQNNLLYTALTYLDSSTYQLIYQSKILTTAVFSRIILKRKISRRKWICLGCLTVGVVLAKIADVSDVGDSADKDNGKDGVGYGGKTIGVICVSLASITSGFSGVYFERILKGPAGANSIPISKKPIKTNPLNNNLWIKNIQMGISSTILSSLLVFFYSYSQIKELGFFHGWNYNTLLIVLLQSLGGLIVSIVVKYLDNIVKVFASSIAIVVCVFYNVFLGGLEVNWVFGGALVLVIGSAGVYGLKETEGRVLPSSHHRRG